MYVCVCVCVRVCVCLLLEILNMKNKIIIGCILYGQNFVLSYHLQCCINNV